MDVEIIECNVSKKFKKCRKPGIMRIPVSYKLRRLKQLLKVVKKKKLKIKKAVIAPTLWTMIESADDEKLQIDDHIDSFLTMESTTDYDSECIQCPVEDEMDEHDPNSYEHAEDNSSVVKLPEVRCFPTRSSACIFVMTSGDRITFHGKIGIQVLHGHVSMLGHVIRRSGNIVPIFSTAANAMTITTDFVASEDGNSMQSDIISIEHLSLDMETEKHLRDSVKENSVVFTIYPLFDPLSKCLKEHFPNLYVAKDGSAKTHFNALCNIEDCTFLVPKRSTTLDIPPEWFNIQCQLKDQHLRKGYGLPLKVLVCGGKNAGKSTLTRYLLNSFLPEYGEALLLDFDPGQAECTPAGFISLVKIREPLLGPPFTHLQEPLKSFFIGGSSPAVDPGHYVSCIRALYASYEALSLESHIPPLFINTMGWTKGLGLRLFIDTILTVHPSHVIQLNKPGNSRVWNFAPMTPDYIKEEDGWLLSSKLEPVLDHDLIQLQSVSTIRDKHDASGLRDLSLIAYFYQLRKLHVDLPFSINSYPPYRILWCSVGICVNREVIPVHQMLYSLNGTLVALGICDPSLLEESADPTLPKFLSHLPICESVGYGIVRGISMEEKAFYIITPVHSKFLSRVNVLIRGSVNLPEQLIHAQRVDGRVPYTTEVKCIKTTFGGKSIRCRSFRDRHSSAMKHEK